MKIFKNNNLSSQMKKAVESQKVNFKLVFKKKTNYFYCEVLE